MTCPLHSPIMSTSKLLTSLFQYKAWADQELFEALKGLDADAHPAERHTAIGLLNHIDVVDRIFVANLQRDRHGYTATNTTETPALEALRAAVQETDRWYLNYRPKYRRCGWADGVRQEERPVSRDQEKSSCVRFLESEPGPVSGKFPSAALHQRGQSHGTCLRY